MSTPNKNRIAGESLLFLLLTLGVLVVVNILANDFNLGRFDLTRNHVYSLSRGSMNTVSRLEDTMTVRVYFTDNLPAEFAGTERQVRDLLTEYRAASRGKLQVRYIRPDNEERVQQAEQDGVQKVSHTVFANDARQQVDGYRGLAIEYRGETKAIPVIAGSEGLEYRLTMLIRELVGTRLKVGVLTGHGTTIATTGVANVKSYLPTYEFVDVDATQAIAADIRALLIINPDSALTDAELRNVDRYVMEGGSLGIFGGAVKLPAQEPQGTVETVDSGVNTLLSKWGLTMESAIVADARCVQRPQRSPDGQMAVEYVPTVPVVMFEEGAASHPASYQLNQQILGFTSPLRRGTVPAGARLTVLGQSSEQSWKLTGSPIAIDPPGGEWRMQPPLGPFPLIAAIEGRLPSAFAASASVAGDSSAPSGPAQARRDVRVLVVGGASMFHETFVPSLEMLQQSGNQQLFGLVAFSLNSIDWLSNDADLIAVRSKTIDAPMLEILQDIQTTQATAERTLNPRDREGIERVQNQLESMQNAFEAKKKALKYGMTLGLPVLVVAFGIVRWQSRNRKKSAAA